MKKWKADWITDPEFAERVPLSLLHKEYLGLKKSVHPVHLKNHHMFFRKTFELSHLPDKAFLDITADDYYKVYINGEYVAEGPAQSYSFHYYYNRLDVQPFLRQGNNVIAVHVFYMGHINRAMNSGDLRQGMIAELYADNQLVVITDQLWKRIRTFEYGDGRAETTGNETQVLEHIDSRLSFPGWKREGYDDSDWSPAAMNPGHGYCFVQQPTPVVATSRIAPIDVRRLEEGHYLIDFGSEIVGCFTMKAYGAIGDRIEIRCGEELEKDGAGVRYEMRCNCLYREIWTLSGRVEEPDFYDYKAFRYVEVIGPEAAIDTGSFGAITRHYPIDGQACQFESDDRILNGIWSICRQGVVLCAQEALLDCPSREKGQYLGDATITGHSHMYLSGDSRLFRKAIQDFALSSAVCPGLLAVAPGSFMQEIADFSLQWPMQLLTYYRYSGDKDFLREMYPYVEGLLAYFRRFCRSDGLLEGVNEKWNLVDWPEPMRDMYDFSLERPLGDGCHNVINAYYYGCVQTVQEIRDILLVPYRDELPALKQVFIDAFLDRDNALFVDAIGSKHSALHSNALPLFFEIAPEETIPSIIHFIRRKGLACGVYMSYFVLKALAKAGEYELVYELITNNGENSWGNMLKEGATSCFEAWGKNQKWNTSLCHGWASAPIPVLIEDIIGLKPAQPGWLEKSLDPHLPAGMPSFELHLTVPTGQISVSYREGKLELNEF
ncbi:family 78 glycoside hydrolase catalytic domain [Paenibacillus sp. HB172176]|uniref:family 78 glycoside hydrolase catalytic domain n=1 Tax=Paenibacillus sp. HB172176 TaxID=2493690 RepID=UPI001439BD27|nr:family 78 glycoside hydrolase catalytic domain [Paenibacillus sp. HB172176]